MRMCFAALAAAFAILSLHSCKEKEVLPGEIKCVTIDASDVTLLAAELNGKLVTDGNPVKDVLLYFYYSDKLTTPEEIHNSGTRIVTDGLLSDDGHFHSNITGLEAQTTYYYIAAAAEKSGVEVLGDVKSFVTEESAIRTDESSNVSETKATLNGHISAKNIQNPSFAKAWFLWSDSEDTLEWLKYKGTKSEVKVGDDGRFSLELTSLKQATRYYYVAIVRYGSNEFYGDVRSFSTLDINAKVSTEDALDLKIVEATLSGMLRLDSKDAMKASVHFLWSDKRMNLEELKQSGTLADAILHEDGSFSYRLDGLMPQSQNWYVAFAKVADKYYYGNVKSFTTRDYVVEAVDLGLPSGVLWSAFNLGATAPEEYGAYYAWGELEPKAEALYDYAHYKWCRGTDDTMTKYCISDEYGTTDNILQLLPEDDVVAVKYGYGWSMPTKAHQAELVAHCSWKWTTRNGVNGCELTSLENGNTLFFPAAGAKVGFGGPGSTFSIWSSSLGKGHSRFADVLTGDFLNFSEGAAYRCHGHTIRPVLTPKTDDYPNT